MHVRKSLNRLFNSLRRKTKEGKVDDQVFDTVESKSQPPHADENLYSSSKNGHVDDQIDSDDDDIEHGKAGYTRWKPTMKRKSNLKKQKGKENEWNVQLSQQQQQQKQRQLNHHHNNSSSTTRFSFMKRKEQSLSRCQLFETDIENEESDNSDFDYEFSTQQQQCDEYMCSKQKNKRKKKGEKTRNTNILHVKADICMDPISNEKHGESDQKCYDNEEFSIDSENTRRKATSEGMMTTGKLVDRINVYNEKSPSHSINRKSPLAESQQNKNVQQQQLFFEKELDQVLASSPSATLPCQCTPAERSSSHKDKVKNTTVSLFSKKQIVLLGMQKSAKRVKKALKEGFIAWGESISYASAVMPQIYATDYPAMASHDGDDFYYCYATNYHQKSNPCCNQNGCPKRETQQLQQQQRDIQLYSQQVAHSSMATNFGLQCNHANHHSQLTY